MANYYGKGRTNYVTVTDVQKFEQVADRLGCEVITTEATINSHDGKLKHGLMDSNDDGAGWSFYDHEEDEELDPIELLAPLLADGEVMVFMETGSEKYRYLVGYAFAFNNKGEQVSVSLNDIYIKAKELGTSITEAGY